MDKVTQDPTQSETRKQEIQSALDAYMAVFLLLNAIFVFFALCIIFSLPYDMLGKGIVIALIVGIVFNYLLSWRMEVELRKRFPAP